jgi:hypothetical protein
MMYQMKPLGCDPQRIKGMSEQLIVSHYENNYGRAVRRLNLIEEQLAGIDFNTAFGYLINGLKRERLIATKFHGAARIVLRRFQRAKRARRRTDERDREATGSTLEIEEERRRES